MVLHISYLASDNNADVLARSHKIITTMIADKPYDLVADAALLFIATGGTEQKVLPLIDKHQAFILIAHREKNSWAATMEIAAYLRDHHKKVLLVDALASDSRRNFEEALSLKKAFDVLNQTRLLLLVRFRNG